ncbi:L,D-transpeptidase [Methylopila henanensis]|uniref:L,D-transpeptidase n=1 Tax=Methylopila henanensis TaxID=873516 RepID=A0ABW4K5E3_9HYPH
MRRSLKIIAVRPLPGARARGRLAAGPFVLPCALGPAGVVVDKREGDGATPRGDLAVRRVFWRPDRGRRPTTAAPTRAIRPDDGWCDAAGHRLYNRLVRTPFAASHERMWRDDGLYDLVVELGWNDRPARQGRGSAIFLHAARPGFTPTAGCVAVAPAKLRRLIALMGPDTVLRVGAPSRPRRRKS